MARIAGIQINKTANGNIKSVLIDYKKHKDLVQPLLESVGAIEEDEFEKEWREGETLEESKQHVINHIKRKNWPK